MSNETELKLPKLGDVQKAYLVSRSWRTFVSLWWVLPIAVPVVLALSSAFGFLPTSQTAVLLVIVLFLLVWGIIYGLLGRANRLYERTLYSDVYKDSLRSWARDRYNVELGERQVRELTGEATVERGVYRSAESFLNLNHGGVNEEQIVVVLVKHPGGEPMLINLWNGQEVERQP